MAAEAEEQIAISVVDLDRGVVTEAVGAGEMDVGGDRPRSSKHTVFVIEVTYVVEGVIVTTRLALPDASLGGVERARTGRVGVGGQGAVAVKGHYGWDGSPDALSAFTVGPAPRDLPHALDCRGCFSRRSVRAPQQ
jgi:hypothetical protein